MLFFVLSASLQGMINFIFSSYCLFAITMQHILLYTTLFLELSVMIIQEEETNRENITDCTCLYFRLLSIGFYRMVARM